jgi:hypothetical protein
VSTTALRISADNPRPSKPLETGEEGAGDEDVVATSSVPASAPEIVTWVVARS